MDHLRFKSEQTAAEYVAGSLGPTVQEEFELHLMSCPDCVAEVESWRALKGCLPLEAAQSRGMRDALNRQPTTSFWSTPAAKPTASPALATASPALAAAVSPASAALPASAAAPASAALPAAPAAKRAAASPATSPAARSASAIRWRVAAALAAGVVVGSAGGWYGRSEQGPSIRSDSIGFYSLPPIMRGPSDCTPVRVGSQVSVLALRVPAAAKEQQLVAVDSEGHDLAPEDYSVATQADGSWLVRVRAEAVRDQGLRFEARSADGTVEPRGCILPGTQS